MALLLRKRRLGTESGVAAERCPPKLENAFRMPKRRDGPNRKRKGRVTNRSAQDPRRRSKFQSRISKFGGPKRLELATSCVTARERHLPRYSDFPRYLKTINKYGHEVSTPIRAGTCDHPQSPFGAAPLMHP